MDKRNTLQRLLGYCPQCGRWFRRVRTGRQNTAYENDEDNFFTGCRACEEENDRYWEAMWADLHSTYSPHGNKPTPHRKIVFLGWDSAQTDRYLSQMAEDNAEQVAWFLRRHGRLAMKDGTVIVNAYCIGKFDGLRFDQIILADDRRRGIMERHRQDIAELLRRCQSSIVPEEFHLQFYDIDAEE